MKECLEVDRGQRKRCYLYLISEKGGKMKKKILSGKQLKEFFLNDSSFRQIRTPGRIRGYRIYGNLEEIDDDRNYLLLENNISHLVVEEVEYYEQN